MADFIKISQILIEEINQLSIPDNIEISPEKLNKITFEDLKIDSLQTIHLAMALEDRLNIELELSEFPKSAHLSELVEFITQLK